MALNDRERQESPLQVNTVWAAVNNVITTSLIKKHEWTLQELDLPEKIGELENLKKSGELRVLSRREILVDGAAATVSHMRVSGRDQIHVSFASLYPGNEKAGKPGDPHDLARIKQTHGDDGPFAKSRVMKGWNEILNAHDPGKPNLWEHVKDEINHIQSKDKKAEVIFSGYSMGAPVTQVAAGRWLAEGHDIGGVYAFAPTRVGNSAFKKGIEKALKDRGKEETPAYIFTKHDDIMHRVPPFAKDGLPGEIYVGRDGKAHFSPMPLKSNIELVEDLVNGHLLKDLKKNHKPPGYVTALEAISKNAREHKDQLSDLLKARDVMSGIEHSKHIDINALEAQWQKAATFIGHAGFEIEGSDIKTKSTAAPQKMAQNVKDEIEVLYNRIITDDKKAVAKYGKELVKDMEAGISATVVGVHSPASGSHRPK